MTLNIGKQSLLLAYGNGIAGGAINRFLPPILLSDLLAKIAQFKLTGSALNIRRPCQTCFPATALMKSRRRIAKPPKAQKQGIVAGQTGSLEVVKTAIRNVRFGSKADIEARPINVRFTPESGHRNRPAYYLRRTSSGSLAIFAAIRRASSC